MGSGQAWAGTGPPNSALCPEALSDTSLWAKRQALSRPLDTGSSCLAMSLLQGGTVPGARRHSRGQHNNHSGSCGLSAPAGATRQDTTRPAGRLLPGACSSRLLCPGCTHEEEGPFPVTSGDHTVGEAATWPSDSCFNFPPPSTSPCSPEAETLLCPGLPRPGQREKTQNRSKSGEGVKGGRARGALRCSAVERRSAEKGQKQENTTPTSATFLPACLASHGPSL